METPYFLISKKLLDDNILAFQTAMKQLWPNSDIGYSVKTNSLPWILGYLKDYKLLAEVVSDEEYQLALLAGYKDEQIIFNGPIKGELVFERACKQGAFINLDSKNDLNLLKKYGDFSTKVGIRMNVAPWVFESRDIEYKDDGFRFGFSEENGEFKRALETVKRTCGDIKIGIHLHCNSITRSENVYIAIAHYIANIIEKYSLKLSFIDMGGGYFGGVPGKTTPYEYIQAIKKELKDVIDPIETRLIVEPGSAIIGSVVDLHTSVLDIKDTVNARIVTTDGSRIHVDPLWINKKDYMYSLNQVEETLPMEKQIICGYTCMDHDRLMFLENKPELSVGDEIVYHRVGAYSITFGGMFIRYYPEVYVQYEDRFEKVRNRISVEEYFDIHSNVKKGYDNIADNKIRREEGV